MFVFAVVIVFVLVLGALVFSERADREAGGPLEALDRALRRSWPSDQR